MKTTVSIPGIHCGSCATLIKDVSADFPEVKSTQVNLHPKQVTLEHNEFFDLKQWTEEVESLNPAYKVTVLLSPAS